VPCAHSFKSPFPSVALIFLDAPKRSYLFPIYSTSRRQLILYKTSTVAEHIEQAAEFTQ